MVKTLLIREMRYNGIMKSKKSEQASHKIKNLLTAIGLSAEMLLKEIPGKLNSEQKKYIREIHALGKKIQSLLKR